MSKGLHVLVSFPALEKTPYNIVTQDHWTHYTKGRGNGKSVWVEVARGTYKEMEALARLMPDPKRFEFED